MKALQQIQHQLKLQADGDWLESYKNLSEAILLKHMEYQAHNLLVTAI